jgi:hypothetical protein
MLMEPVERCAVALVVGALDRSHLSFEARAAGWRDDRTLGGMKRGHAGDGHGSEGYEAGRSNEVCAHAAKEGTRARRRRR